MATKLELEKMIKLLKEETGKLQKVNKQRFDRVKELEERMKIQGMQLSLLFEVLGHDRKHRGFVQLIQMLGRLTQFWNNKPMSKLEEQIRGMEETGLINLEDIEEDEDIPPFLR
mgnify:CR=1 FL=1|tara:strand:+ start:573 stop:914 length:342 start_codon:yes stop_codon:yes gene_type:complete